MIRVDKREPAQMRELKITPNPLRNAEGSALIEIGGTKVLCAATLDEKAPPHLKGSGTGWLTAEYAMLPRSSAQRIPRDGMRGKVNARSQEIQRLVGRTLRSVFRMEKFGERTMIIDCDVIEADGGTRCASITGGFVALALALRALRSRNKVGAGLLTDFASAISVGIVEGQPVLDLCYIEDSQADVDMNLAATSAGNIIEIQGTAEKVPYNRAQLNELLDLGFLGCNQLIAAQKEILGINDIAEL
ncbi:TPA: ribonuclease PH [Candidatus Sumerlaeota bacterium]|jgi:ribonuclease PH|nr:ribonuclease PH [Candidatus Sumerlaeota bacterium]